MAHPGPGGRGCGPSHPAHMSPGPGGTVYDVNHCAYIADPRGGAQVYTGNPTPYRPGVSPLSIAPSFTGVPAVIPAVISGTVGALGGIGDVADMICRYFPNLCNIAVPGQPYPTPSPRTPAPPTPGTPITPGFVPGTGECPGGYHWNKGRYLTRQGVVEQGTRCVKNRRMNPTNPRALARAIRRGDSFVRLAKSFGLGAPKTGLKKRRKRC